MNDNPSWPVSRRSAGSRAPGGTRRVLAVDAARGLALVGLTAIHFLPGTDQSTGDPTWSWILFAGDSAALLALLAGVGLGLFSGGRTPPRGQRMTGARVGVAVRALLIFVVGMSLRYLMPADTSAVNILPYYGVFFLLSVPFLHLPPRKLLIGAGGLALLSPVLILGLRAQLPAYTSSNPTFADLFLSPAATIAQFLITGTYPALAYLTYLLTGLALGRLDLRRCQVRTGVLVAGVGLALLARLISWILLHVLGGYEQLRQDVPSGSREELERILVFGPDTTFVVSSWWLGVTTPHANTPLAIASSLGAGLIVLGSFLLLTPRAGAWLLPLSSIGVMTLTLYSAQLVLPSFGVHDDRPVLWFTIYLTAAVVFALIWQRIFGQGPLERLVSMTARGASIRIASAPR